jgi:hypothetical protein
LNVLIRVDARASGLVIYGEVYVVVADPDREDRFVAHIHASNGNDYGLGLPPESYILKFHVTAGLGPYRVSVLREDETPLAFKDFDTANGITGKTIRFEVRQ